MIAIAGGFAIALGVAAWVLWPLVGAAPSGAPTVCPTCGPRPERDARFCSNCGAPLEP